MMKVSELSWGHTATTPYARSSVVAVIGLPLAGTFRHELVEACGRGARVFGRAVFARLTADCQMALRRLARRGISSL